MNIIALSIKLHRRLSSYSKLCEGNDKMPAKILFHFENFPKFWNEFCVKIEYFYDEMKRGIVTR